MFNGTDHCFPRVYVITRLCRRVMSIRCSVAGFIGVQATLATFPLFLFLPFSPRGQPYFSSPFLHFIRNELARKHPPPTEANPDSSRTDSSQFQSRLYAPPYLMSILDATTLRWRIFFLLSSSRRPSFSFLLSFFAALSSPQAGNFRTDGFIDSEGISENFSSISPRCLTVFSSLLFYFFLFYWFG